MRLSNPPGAFVLDDYAQPAGEPALVPPESVSWQVFRNPLTILIGGIAAVVLELAEPKVRAGVYEHSGFRRDPLARLQRTGRATMVTVYGARSRAQDLIGGVNRLHRSVTGTSAAGERYAATDPELLTWVHATASYGFMAARDAYVVPIAESARDRYYREGRHSALLYGAVDSPVSCREMQDLFDAHRPSLEPTPLVFEFLQTMHKMPLLPRALARAQWWVVRAAVELLPAWVRDRLGLDSRWGLAPWQLGVVRTFARGLDPLVLAGTPPIQALRRLGLPDDYLVRLARAR